MGEKIKIVLLTGAGISEESGLGTFRGTDGLWDNYKIEEVATPTAWYSNPKLVLDFYNLRRNQNIKSSPNKAHLALVELEKKFDVYIITQNIDDLHERAGSSNVLHLHGEIMKGKTMENPDTTFEVGEFIQFGEVDVHGHQIRPHVVWFGEAVPEMEKAISLVLEAEIFIVVGTSLNVYPAANLVDYVPENAALYLVDPQEVNYNFRQEFKQINSKASVGVVELVKKYWKHKKRSF